MACRNGGVRHGRHLEHLHRAVGRARRHDAAAHQRGPSRPRREPPSVGKPRWTQLVPPYAGQPRGLPERDLVLGAADDAGSASTSRSGVLKDGGSSSSAVSTPTSSATPTSPRRRRPRRDLRPGHRTPGRPSPSRPRLRLRPRRLHLDRARGRPSALRRGGANARRRPDRDLGSGHQHWVEAPARSSAPPRAPRRAMQRGELVPCCRTATSSPSRSPPRRRPRTRRCTSRPGHVGQRRHDPVDAAGRHDRRDDAQRDRRRPSR